MTKTYHVRSNLLVNRSVRINENQTQSGVEEESNFLLAYQIYFNLANFFHKSQLNSIQLKITFWTEKSKGNLKVIYKCQLCSRPDVTTHIL